MEPDSSCLRPFIIKEVKCLGNSKHVCRFLESTSVCPCIVSLISKTGGEIDIVLFQRGGSNGSECVSYLEMLWWLEVESTKFYRVCFLFPSCAGKSLGKVSSLGAASLLICLFIFLWAIFDSFSPTFCSFSDMSRQVIFACCVVCKLHLCLNIFPYEFYFVQCKSTPNYPCVSGGFPLD